MRHSPLALTLSVSFGALRSFIEVGRQASIKQAARELHVTPGAVSQQIKALEAHFGVQLLTRGNREVRLSADGLRLYAKIAPAFEQIDAAVQLFDGRQPGRKTLVISTVPSFAACWLTARQLFPQTAPGSVFRRGDIPNNSHDRTMSLAGRPKSAPTAHQPRFLV